jgi:hypothetical protein
MSSTKKDGPATQKTPGRYAPAHGRDYDIRLRAMDEYETSRTRDKIAYLVLGTVLGAIIAAATYGLWQQNFGALNAVWTVAGPITGAILGYYFHRGRKD